MIKNKRIDYFFKRNVCDEDEKKCILRQLNLTFVFLIYYD